jgi:nitroimidazol reductase NimA-like FMN-containing flavoprotein (pyridoxamine 5'-phosphate oxidase superfamily)
MKSNDFVQTERSRLRRLPDRGSHARDDIYAVLDAGLVCQVGLIFDGRPLVIPMGYGRRGDRLFLHGGSTSRLLKSLATGTDVCITVTLVDGIVLARSNFHSSLNYRSVVAFGRTRVLEDHRERLEALDAIVDQLVPGRAEETRESTAKELGVTHVIEVTIDEATAKVRTGPPLEPAEDRDVPVWAGVIPLEARPGTPIPAPDLDPRYEASSVVTGWMRGSRRST